MMRVKFVKPTLSSEWHLIGRHLWAVLKPHRLRVILVIFLVLVTSVMEGASYSLLLPLTQVLASQSGRGGDTGILHIYQESLAGYAPERQLAILGVAVIILFGIKGGLHYFREVFSTRLWLGVGCEIREKLLVRMMQRPYAYYLEHKQGTLVQQLYYEPQHVGYVVQIAIEQTANLITIAILFGLLVVVSWQVTLFVLAFCGIYGLGIWWLSKRSQLGGEERQRVEGEALALLTETIGGIRQVKVFKAEDRIRRLYAGWVTSLRDLLAHHWLTALLPQRATEMFWVAVLGLLLCLPAVGLVGDFQSILPVVAVFSAVAFRMGPYMARMSQGWQTVQFYLPAMRLIDQLSMEPPGSVHRRDFRTFSGLARAIRFEDVSFSYGRGSFGLAKVTLQINHGEVTAIVGPSGSGKSTLVDMLVRLYDPTSGRITVDGVDLRDYDRDSWLAAIGFVSQDTFVFHGTVRDNIAFALPGCSMERIEEVARQANADAFIQRLPNGYETVIGDRGLKLSGGERQRIAIARALLREPQVLIFDEATSALDNQSEALIQETIANIARDRTVILVAHRLSTIVKADKIVVLENGMIVEEGTHAALLMRGGLYAAMYSKGLA